MLAEQPEAAVVVPCFNAADTIEETLASVLAQTFERFEAVVVDDGSSDDSVDVVQRVAQGDRRIHLVRQANAGVSAARNTAISETSAPLIGLLDADDCWRENFLAVMTAAFDDDPDLGVAFARAEIMDLDGQSTGTTTSFSPTSTDVAELLLTNPAGTCSTVMLRREVVETVGPFETKLRRVEDQHWMLKARLGNWDMRGIDEVLVSYRTSGDGLSADLEGMLDGWDAMVDMLELSLTPEQIRNARAEHLLYLTRRSVRLGRPLPVSLGYLRQAAAEDPRVPLRKAAQLPGVLLRRLRPEPAEECAA